jgi:exodeoxyribonuclease VIII
MKIWGNGSSFDCGILGEAYKRCGMTPPWKFYMERDLRTIMDIGKVKMCDLPQYGKHNAIYDCYRQIIGLQRAEKKIGFIRS